MKYPRCIARTLLLAGCWLLGANPASAQLDRLYPQDSNSPETGTVIQTTRDSITFKIGANSKNYLPGEVRKILFQGDPAELTRGRQFALDNQYEEALAELKKINIGGLPRDVIKAEAQFFIVWCEAKLALEGRGDKKTAITAALDFAKNNQDSWHFYEVAKLLGDLALAIKNHAQALKYYGSLRNAPSAETKIESVYLTGLVQLAQGNGKEAMVEFDKVAGVAVANTRVARMQTLAKAGKAVALAKQGDGEAGLKLVDSLIAELNPTDVEMAARIYNAQGASYEALDDREGAIIAYLHTHLMFSSQPDAHAESLVRLVELWPKVGKPERAAEARQELQQRYPGFGK
jgi:tetratricopeptide (TPR) repeat protein